MAATKAEWQAPSAGQSLRNSYASVGSTAAAHGLWFWFGWQDSDTSALCRTGSGRAMSAAPAKRRFVSITARPTPELKNRFAEAAARRGLSESGLALIAVRTYLELTGFGPSPPAAPRAEPATDRITIRLRPGDRRAIGWRASQRGTTASTYIAALVRAHIAANPPLTREELQALKVAVAVLAGAGRVLHPLARHASTTGQLPDDLRQEVSRLATAVKALEERTSEFARAALVSWETSSD